MEEYNSIKRFIFFVKKEKKKLVIRRGGRVAIENESITYFFGRHVIN